MRVEHHLPPEVPDDQFAAAMDRGQYQRQGRKHAGSLFGVPVLDKEAAGVVDEQLIKIGRDRLADAEAAGRLGNEFSQAALPMAPADADPARFDLPGSPDLAIDQRRLAATIGCRLRDGDQLLELHRQQREGDAAHALDIDRRHQDLLGPADAKIARTLDRTQAGRQRSTDRCHGGSRQRRSEDRASAVASRQADRPRRIAGGGRGEYPAAERRGGAAFLPGPSGCARPRSVDGGESQPLPARRGRSSVSFRRSGRGSLILGQGEDGAGRGDAAQGVLAQRDQRRCRLRRDRT
jgi:hypothetical protein